MNPLSETDRQTPGGVYLCQISETVSCGACCGLYNLADASRDHLHAMLTWRTETFVSVPREIDAIVGFGQQALDREPEEAPYPDFHHCPYIGLIGPERTRVGCLLHPLADGNSGVDYRGISYYGGMACRTYFCPACRRLPKRYKEIVRYVSTDWYDYGLLVTESRLLSALFQEAEQRIGRPLQLSAVHGEPERVAAVRSLLRLKMDWPFRFRPEKLVHYFFEDGQYIRPLRYAGGGFPPTPYHTLFTELESTFPSHQSWQAAHRQMDRRLEEFKRAFVMRLPQMKKQRLVQHMTGQRGDFRH